VAFAALAIMDVNSQSPVGAFNPKNPYSALHPDNPANIHSPANLLNPRNPLNVANPYNLANPTNPANVFNPQNPLNILNPYNIANPTNPTNVFSPQNPHNPLGVTSPLSPFYGPNLRTLGAADVGRRTSLEVPNDSFCSVVTASAVPYACPNGFYPVCVTDGSHIATYDACKYHVAKCYYPSLEIVAGGEGLSCEEMAHR